MNGEDGEPGVEELAMGAIGFDSSGAEEHDQRSVSILTDQDRMEFLAVLDWTQAVSWNQVYTRYVRQERFCREVGAKREKEGNVGGARRMFRFAERWGLLIEAWEKWLVLTASVKGFRSKQVVEGLKAEKAVALGEGEFTRVRGLEGEEGEGGGEKRGGGLFSRRRRG